MAGCSGDGAKVAAFCQIAVQASKGQIGQRCATTMLLAADVLDLESNPIIPLMQQTILAKTRSSLPNLPTQSDWNMLTHAEIAARRARAFTRDMM